MSDSIRPDLSFAADVSGRASPGPMPRPCSPPPTRRGWPRRCWKSSIRWWTTCSRPNRKLAALFSSAAVGVLPRRAALDKAFAGRASEVFLAFLQVLNSHERLDLIAAIRQAAHEIDDERKNRLHVLVQSAVPLPESISSALTERIRGAFHKEPVLHARVDKTLLGGLKIRIGDLQVDSTVRNYLDNMKKQILARSSHEIQSRRDRFSSADGN